MEKSDCGWDRGKRRVQNTPAEGEWDVRGGRWGRNENDGGDDLEEVRRDVGSWTGTGWAGPEKGNGEAVDREPVAAVDGSSTEWTRRATSAEKPPKVTKWHSHESQTGDGGR
jgi:hypothetical protein